ncbi:MAG: hypothetical protein RL023_786 [Candidatus Parcubacteria bacterium]
MCFSMIAFVLFLYYQTLQFFGSYIIGPREQILELQDSSLQHNIHIYNTKQTGDIYESISGYYLYPVYKNNYLSRKSKEILETFVYHKPRIDKKIYLTIDDGPSLH